ncbi:hypothetical protein BP6252_10274 [Coleophoma cylindrospora]|uniref:Major facilitator superfamily (MFS) profile domain-containing protein n=1 Tax=Coleophoma cylindrospora TaxID=1849047 RepID=A0A3D8QS22_9HELO|nr:hypothetical protein BP6252_10274 [Coleophoma cylindrospora]
MSSQPLGLIWNATESGKLAEPQRIYQGSTKNSPPSSLPPHVLGSPIASASPVENGRRPELEPFTVKEPPQHGFAAAEVAPTVWEPYKNRFRFVASCLVGFIGGLNDSAPGALLPYIEEQVFNPLWDYSIGYAVVSTIFVANALGFIAAAFFINTITKRFGRGKALILSESLLVISYVTVVVKPPFPVVVVAFFLTGLGAAIHLAICNVFVANLRNGPFFSGIFQGMYGVGGTIGPLIATSLVRNGYHWSTFYFTTLGIAAFNVGWCGWSFWGYEKDTPQHHDGPVTVRTSASPLARARKLVTHRPTLFGAMFIFAYQGIEVAISGWVVSFLVSYRGGDLTKVGYVSAGFWAGITLGRFFLSYLGSKIGERIFVFGIIAGTLVLQLLVWFVPSIIGDSIAVSLAGFLLGPIYPAATATFVRLIPKRMQVSSFSFIAGVGSSGGAFIPFLTGLLAQQAGTWVLHPICIGLFAAMAGTWYMLSEKHQSTE